MNDCTDTIERFSETMPAPATWRAWLAAGWTLFADDARALSVLLDAWHGRASSRRQLATLSDAQLRDFGLDRAQAWRESRKPFWRA